MCMVWNMEIANISIGIYWGLLLELELPNPTTVPMFIKSDKKLNT